MKLQCKSYPFLVFSQSILLKAKDRPTSSLTKILMKAKKKCWLFFTKYCICIYLSSKIHAFWSTDGYQRFSGHPVACYVGWHSRTGLFVEREQTKQIGLFGWEHVFAQKKGSLGDKVGIFSKKGVFSEN